MSIMTDHGGERLAKRSGVGKKASEKLAEKALANGIWRDNTTGNMRKFLDRQYFNVGSGRLLLVYNGDVFVFANKDGGLITMFPLPGNLKHSKAARERK